MIAPLLVLLALPAVFANYACRDPTKAMVYLKGPGKTAGTIYLKQAAGTDEVHITGEITGLNPGGKHGFHIHSYGDIYSDGCMTTGGHYNPFEKDHGAPTDRVRHVGDLGNIQAAADGTVHLDIKDNKISLCGRRTILGRGIVVHEGEDDLGLGGHNDSKTTGHAGKRAACGIIATVDPTK